MTKPTALDLAGPSKDDLFSQFPTNSSVVSSSEQLVKNIGTRRIENTSSFFNLIIIYCFNVYI